MAVLKKLVGSRVGRVVWGLLALLLAAGLLVSTMMAGKALTDEKKAAEQRAEFLTNTVLFNSLTPEIVSDVIFGPDYRSLIITVQGQILADSAIGPDAIAQVRIWKPDGTLIFSTAQRDKIGEFVAKGNPQIEQALAGHTVSLLTEAQVAPKAGLQGSQERLYETFVPLHLPNQIGVLAAVQIDTRYAAIAAAADRVWRPVQLGLLAGLIVALLLFVMSLRKAPAAVPTEGAPIADLADADRRVQLAERAAAQAAEETRKAEGVTKGYQEKLATSEQRLRETIAAARGLEGDVKEATTRIPALEAELERLQDLSAAQAEPSKDEIGAKAEAERLATALKDSELERDRATQEVRRVLESVTALEAEVARVTAQLASAETARAAHEAEAKQAVAEVKKAKESKDKKAAAELSKAQLSLQEATAKLAEVERLAQTSEDKHGRVSVDLQLVRKSLLEREAELKKLRDELAARDAGLQAAAAKVSELEAAAAKVSELEPKAAKVSELEARIRELEDARRREVVELQTAQERLANSQAELIATTKRAKESEEKLKSALAAAAETTAAAAAARERGVFEEASFEPSATLAGRLSRLAHKPEQVPSEEPEAATVEAAPVEAATADAAAAAEAGSEAESLRSRLARAAAARHRPPSTPSSGSSG